MNKSIHTARGVTCLLICLATAVAEADEPTIGDFLYNLGSGPMAANEVIKLEPSAVSNIQTAKDLALAVGSLGDDASKNGFGIAFTPGRSQFEALAVSLSRYADRRDVLGRVWGNTTFSYAQNKLSRGGADYERSALAVNVSYYLNAEQDPIVAARDAVIRNAGSCSPVLADLFRSQAELLKSGMSLKRAMGLAETEALPIGVITWLSEVANNREAAPPAAVANLLPKIVEGQQSGAIKVADQRKLGDDLRACVQKAQTEAKKRWNASQATFLLAQGWIKPASGVDPQRLSLGKHATAAIALGYGDNGLFNLTLRHVRKEVELDTLTGTPSYKNTNVAAARYTYGQPGRDTYGLAEISNVKLRNNTMSNSSFKQALGIDHKIAAGFWIEFRYGRARTADGDKLENKALLNIKFSPESTLDKKI